MSTWQGGADLDLTAYNRKLERMIDSAQRASKGISDAFAKTDIKFDITFDDTDINQKLAAFQKTFNRKIGQNMLDSTKDITSGFKGISKEIDNISGLLDTNILKEEKINDILRERANLYKSMGGGTAPDSSISSQTGATKQATSYSPQTKSQLRGVERASSEAMDAMLEGMQARATKYRAPKSGGLYDFAKVENTYSTVLKHMVESMPIVKAMEQHYPDILKKIFQGIDEDLARAFTSKGGFEKFINEGAFLKTEGALDVIGSFFSQINTLMQNIETKINYMKIRDIEDFPDPIKLDEARLSNIKKRGLAAKQRYYNRLEELKEMGISTSEFEIDNDLLKEYEFAINNINFVTEKQVREIIKTFNALGEQMNVAKGEFRLATQKDVKEDKLKRNIAKSALEFREISELSEEYFRNLTEAKRLGIDDEFSLSVKGYGDIDLSKAVDEGRLDLLNIYKKNLKLQIKDINKRIEEEFAIDPSLSAETDEVDIRKLQIESQRVLNKYYEKINELISFRGVDPQSEAGLAMAQDLRDKFGFGITDVEKYVSMEDIPEELKSASFFRKVKKDILTGLESLLMQYEEEFKEYRAVSREQIDKNKLIEIKSRLNTAILEYSNRMSLASSLGLDTSKFADIGGLSIEGLTEKIEGATSSVEDRQELGSFLAAYNAINAELRKQINLKEEIRKASEEENLQQQKILEKHNKISILLDELSRKEKQVGYYGSIIEGIEAKDNVLESFKNKKSEDLSYKDLEIIEATLKAKISQYDAFISENFLKTSDSLDQTMDKMKYYQYSIASLNKEYTRLLDEVSQNLARDGTVDVAAELKEVGISAGLTQEQLQKVASMDSLSDVKEVKRIFDELEDAFRRLKGLAKERDIKIESIGQETKRKSIISDIELGLKTYDDLMRKLGREGTPIKFMGVDNVREVDLTKKSLKELEVILQEIKRVNREAQRELDGTARGSVDKIGERIQKIVSWTISVQTVRLGMRALRSGVREVIDTESALVDLNKIMNLTAKEMDRLYGSTYKLGQAYGFLPKEAISASEIFAKQGRSVSEIEELTRVALLAENITEMSSVQASKYLTGAVNQLEKDTSRAINILDAWNNVANKNAVSSLDLAEATMETAAAARLVGIDMDLLNGIITSLAAATAKSGSEIGSALKFMFQRSRLDSTIAAFGGIGISVMKDKKNYREMGDILQELANKWDYLSEKQKTTLARAMGGRRYSEFIILMDNWEKAQKAYVDSLASAGSAEKENEKYMQSLMKVFKQFSGAFSNLAVEIGKSGFVEIIKNTTKILTTFINTISYIPKPLLAATTAILGFSAAAKILGLTLSVSSLGIAGILGVGIWGISELTRVRETETDMILKNIDAMDREYQQQLAKIKANKDEYRSIQDKNRALSQLREQREKDIRTSIKELEARKKILEAEIKADDGGGREAKRIAADLGKQKEYHKELGYRDASVLDFVKALTFSIPEWWYGSKYENLLGGKEKELKDINLELENMRKILNEILYEAKEVEIEDLINVPFWGKLELLEAQIDEEVSLHRQKVERLDKAFKAGAISLGEYYGRLEELEHIDPFQKLIQSVQELNNTLKTDTKRAFETAFGDLFSGKKDFFESFSEAIENINVKLMASVAAEKVMSGRYMKDVMLGQQLGLGTLMGVQGKYRDMWGEYVGDKVADEEAAWSAIKREPKKLGKIIAEEVRKIIPDRFYEDNLVGTSSDLQTTLDSLKGYNEKAWETVIAQLSNLPEIKIGGKEVRVTSEGKVITLDGKKTIVEKADISDEAIQAFGGGVIDVIKDKDLIFNLKNLEIDKIESIKLPSGSFLTSDEMMGIQKEYEMYPDPKILSEKIIEAYGQATLSLAESVYQLDRGKTFFDNGSDRNARMYSLWKSIIDVSRDIGVLSENIAYIEVDGEQVVDIMGTFYNLVEKLGIKLSSLNLNDYELRSFEMLMRGLLSSRGFSSGGYTGIGGKFELAGVVHKGEYVIPDWIVNNYPELVAQIEGIRLGRGFASGGDTVPKITSEQKQAQIEKYLKEMSSNVIYNKKTEEDMLTVINSTLEELEKTNKQLSDIEEKQKRRDQNTKKANEQLIRLTTQEVVKATLDAPLVKETNKILKDSTSMVTGALVGTLKGRDSAIDAYKTFFNEYSDSLRKSMPGFFGNMAGGVVDIAANFGLQELMQTGLFKYIGIIGGLGTILDADLQRALKITLEDAMPKLLRSMFGVKGYSLGGYTGAGGKFDVAGVVHRNEYIIPDWIVNNYPDLVAQIEGIRLGKGFAQGGSEIAIPPLSIVKEERDKALLKTLNDLTLSAAKIVPSIERLSNKDLVDIARGIAKEYSFKDQFYLDMLSKYEKGYTDEDRLMAKYAALNIMGGDFIGESKDQRAFEVFFAGKFDSLEKGILDRVDNIDDYFREALADPSGFLADMAKYDPNLSRLTLESQMKFLSTIEKAIDDFNIENIDDLLEIYKRNLIRFMDLTGEESLATERVLSTFRTNVKILNAEWYQVLSILKEAPEKMGDVVAGFTRMYTQSGGALIAGVSGAIAGAISGTTKEMEAIVDINKWLGLTRSPEELEKMTPEELKEYESQLLKSGTGAIEGLGLITTVLGGEALAKFGISERPEKTYSMLMGGIGSIVGAKYGTIGSEGAQFIGTAIGGIFDNLLNKTKDKVDEEVKSFPWQKTISTPDYFAMEDRFYLSGRYAALLEGSANDVARTMEKLDKTISEFENTTSRGIRTMEKIQDEPYRRGGVNINQIINANKTAKEVVDEWDEALSSGLWF